MKKELGAFQDNFVSEHDRLKKPRKTPMEWKEEQLQRNRDFQWAEAQKKKKITSNLQPHIASGQNQDIGWNKPQTNQYFDEELAPIPYQTDFMPVLTSEQMETEEESEEQYEQARLAKIDPTSINMPKANKTSDSSSLFQFGYLVLINKQIVFKTNDLEEVKEVVKQLLLENEDLEVDDIFVFKRMKLSTGVILE